MCPAKAVGNLCVPQARDSPKPGPQSSENAAFASGWLCAGFWSLRGLRHQGGALVRNGLAVPHAKVFDFLLYATHQLDPAIATIARKAAISARGARAGQPQGRLGVELAATPHRQHAKLRSSDCVRRPDCVAWESAAAGAIVGVRPDQGAGVVQW